MGQSDDSARRQWVQAVTGVTLLMVGASALLWLIFDERLPTTTSTPDPAGLTIWAVVRLAGGGVLAAGAWLLALAMVSRRRRQF